MSIYAARFRGDVPTQGRGAWIKLYNTPSKEKATGAERCECGKLVVFTTDGDGNLVALDALTRVRHECEG